MKLLQDEYFNEFCPNLTSAVITRLMIKCESTTISNTRAQETILHTKINNTHLVQPNRINHQKWKTILSSIFS